MGGELGKLSEYTLYEPSIQQNSKHLFSLHAATDADGKPASVLIHEDDNSGNRAFAENEVQLLRRLRHPQIVKYLYSPPPVDSGPVQVVMEFVEPLESVDANLHNMEIAVGLRGIVQALSFLHDTCRLSHNNVCRDSVVVAASDRTWRLAGFALASKFEATSLLYLKQIATWRDADAIPPEDKRSSGQMSRCVHARDAWGFGSLVLSFADQLGTYSELEAKLSESLLHPEPECRPTMKSQLHNSLLSNQLTKVIQFVGEITLKQPKEKNAFFRSLPKRLVQIPATLVAQHLTSRLLSRFVLLEESAREHMVPILLMPQESSRQSPHSTAGLFPESLYKEYVIPLLLKLYMVEDKHIRLVLLQYLEYYMRLVDRSTLQTEILPHVLVGMNEDDDDLVAATFHSLAHLVGVLGANAVVGCQSVSRFASTAPRSDGPKQFHVQSLRAATSYSPPSSHTSTSPPSSFGSPTYSQSTHEPSQSRQPRASRPSCLKTDQKPPNRLPNRRQSPKSPKSMKHVTFSPDNEFPTTEEDLLMSPTWQRHSSALVGGLADGHLSNGLPPHGDGRGGRVVQQPSISNIGAAFLGSDGSADEWPAMDLDSDTEDRAKVTKGEDLRRGSGGGTSEHSPMRTAAAAGTSPASADIFGDDDDDDDDAWEDFNDDPLADGDDGWPVDTGGDDCDDWSKDEGGTSFTVDKKSPVRSGSLSGSDTSFTTSLLPVKGKLSKLPMQPKVSPTPAASGLDLSAKSKSKGPAPKADAKAAKAANPTPIIPIQPSAEDLLLADLEPDINFSVGSATPAPAKVSVASSSKRSAVRPAIGSTKSAAVSATSMAVSTPSPAAAGPISFAYQPSDPQADESGGGGGDGWGDDDFEDF